MDAVSILYLTITVSFPVMIGLGFDPIWFGVILGIALEVGLLTPPMGLNLYVCQGVTEEPFMEIVKGSVPFFLVMILNMILLTFVPQLATWLPSKM